MQTIHRVWRALPVAPRRALLARGTALLAPRPAVPAPAAVHGLAVAGETRRASGLGEGARLMLAALAGMGVRCWEVPVDLLEGQAAPPDLPPGAPLVLHVNPPMLAAALLRLGPAARGRRLIGYWAWELPVAPPLWRHAARLVHEAWVPSRFTAAAIEPLLPGRVRVVPHPIAAAPPAPSTMSRMDFGWPADAVVVLVSFSLASSYARKNPEAAIAAFRAAFADRADRLLVLKVLHAEHAPEDMRRLAAMAQAPNIRIETRTLPAADNLAMTAAADIVLSLHRSEGFGLVPAEAMLLERPVVATDWSATAEFLDASCGVPVPYRLVPARDPRGVFEAPGAVWAEADVGAAAAALASLAGDADWRAALGHAARAAAMARLGDAALRDAVVGLELGA